MEFEKLVAEILQEDVVSGGDGSAFGPNVGNTATAFSGDKLSPNDARVPYSVYGGILTRGGLRNSKRRKKTKKK